jgi:hypothetical protein
MPKSVKKCTLCHKVFGQAGDLRRHVDTVHLGLKKYVCDFDECAKAFGEASNLRAHISMVHMGSKKHVCDFDECAKAFGLSSGLRRHVSTVHMGSKKYVCDFDQCTKAFAETCNLRAHISTVHMGSKKYVCDFNECTKAFGKAGDLSRHVDTVHLGLKKYVCDFDECTQAFGLASNLRVHISTVHMGSKKYVCDFGECTQAFGHAGNLRKHMDNVHMGLKKYVCDFGECTQAFGLSSSLRKHVDNVHMGLKKYVCDFGECTQAFGYVGNLRRHMAEHYTLWVTDLIAERFPEGRPTCTGSTLGLIGERAIPDGLPDGWLDKCGVGVLCCHARLRDACGIKDCGGGAWVCTTCNIRRFSRSDKHNIDGVRCCVTCFFIANPSSNAELTEGMTGNVTLDMWCTDIPSTRYTTWDGSYYVYIFSLTSARDIVKIGYSKAPAERLLTLQTETTFGWTVHSCVRFNTRRDAWAVEQYIQDKTKDSFVDLVDEYGFPIFGGRSEVRRLAADTVGPMLESVSMSEVHTHVMGIVTAERDHQRGGKYLRNCL